MNEINKNNKRTTLFSILEISCIILLAIVPLFSTFPYRVNIFLSWEGAYRLSLGQIPYKDFGMPLGYMYWVVPALFFKVFGPQLITLIKAQVFINIISGFAFRSILKSITVQPGIRFLSVLLYCLSFSFFNFWPWYNHTVIVYEMVALAFLFQFFTIAGKRRWVFLLLCSLFTFFSFFTKQDGGGMAFLLCCSLLLLNSLLEKKWMPLFIYFPATIAIGFAFIYPLTKYNFGYWFNHGQPPHTSRVSVFEIIDEFFAGSQWIKFYLFLIAILLLTYVRDWRQWLSNKKFMLFFLLTLGILAEASVLQITSYTPPDNNIFFHSFAFAFILFLLANRLNINFLQTRWAVIGIAGILLWWSGTFWKYLQRIAERALPATASIQNSGENIVNRKTYIINRDTSEIPMSEWTYTHLKAFKHIYMPKQTVEGIDRLLNSDLVKSHRDLKVLNMSELTPLAVELPYQLETGPNVPLWYHLGVAMFNKDAATFEQKIAEKQYDLILFEYIPSLNNFYPFRVRDSLQVYYQRTDSFPAPRRGETSGLIEIYTKPVK